MALINKKYRVNKKLWSFNFGCVIACSLLWFIGLGKVVPVPEVLHQYPRFILDYYPSLVTAAAMFLLTVFVVWLMKRAFDICVSEHTFWLLIPTISLLLLTTLTAFELLSAMLYAALPSLIIILPLAVVSRLTQQSVLLTKKCAN